MARASNGAHKVKLEEGDIVVGQFGVKGKVTQVMVIPALLCVDGVTSTHVDVLVSVLYKGADVPVVLNMEEIEAIRFENAWVNRMGEPVEV